MNYLVTTFTFKFCAPVAALTKTNLSLSPFSKVEVETTGKVTPLGAASSVVKAKASDAVFAIMQFCEKILDQPPAPPTCRSILNSVFPEVPAMSFVSSIL
jgi:hypothetical protein